MVDYVKGNFLNGRVFVDLEDLNTQGWHWLTTVASVRIHSTTKQRPIDLLGGEGLVGLGVITAELGHRVYFTTAIEAARRLTKAMAENRLHREMNNLVRPKLLVIDEVGYLELDQAQASLLFQVISQRYEKNGAIVLASNKAFSEWGDVFAKDAVMASAALDRLLHRSTVINIRGESFRLREKRKASSAMSPGVDSEAGGDR